jgi:non-specific serine/threonine protein kinase
VAFFQGDYASAWAQLKESLAIRRELGDRGGMALMLNNLGVVTKGQGEFASARALYEESLAIRRDLGDQGGIADSLHNLGIVASDQSDYASARPLFEESLAIWRKLGHRLGIPCSLDGLATVIAALGGSLRAAGIWGAAERLREEIGSPLSPSERLEHDPRVAAARAALGDDAAFDCAWREGRAFTLEQAIALTLAESVERG